jgi:hypothetical protein
MLTACRLAIDEEYPTRLDTTGAPLGAALLDSFTEGTSASVSDGSWTEPGASSSVSMSPRFATASGELCSIKSIMPMSTAMATAAAWASLSCVQILVSMCMSTLRH